MKHLTNVCVIILLIAQSVFAQVVEIPDPQLEVSLREALKLSPGTPITKEAMLRLTGFAAEVKSIEDITGLKYARNLKNLYLRNNPIKDLGPLANLTQLKLLHLVGVPITDLTPIQNLTKLRELHLSHCGITDITAVQDLTQLVFLNLAVNRIKDISPLTNLTELETLWLHSNKIRDINPLTDLIQLASLNLKHNRIADISPLVNLTQLITLNLHNNLIMDISPLANLIHLKTLDIDANLIVDFSSIQGLSIPDFWYDEICVLPDLPIQDRIENRSLPSVFQKWNDGILGVWDNLPTLSHLSYQERIAYHDLYWNHFPFGLRFQQVPPWSRITGDIDRALRERDELLSKNPNMLFLVEIRQKNAHLGSQYPEDWFGWLRDEAGNLIHGSRNHPNSYLIDFRQPEVQHVIVQQAVSVSKCGLYDGIIFDSWTENFPSLQDPLQPFYQEGTPEYYHAAEEEREARVSILKQIRENVPDDFLILVNSNHYQVPFSIPYTNGGNMETFHRHEGGYTRDDIVEIETNLIWYEENAREPQINCLIGVGIGTELPDSPNNRRWMRLFTTMSLTLSDGYVHYTLGGGSRHHIWYPFWDADLGQPISPTDRRYQNIDGLYIRKFTNGWAVYNRSGNPQTISLPQFTTGVSSRKSGTTHQLPDLDGEIYLKAPHPADVNRDWIINILDLVQVANGFGTSTPDPNGDGIVNILDLVFVSQHSD